MTRKIEIIIFFVIGFVIAFLFSSTVILGNKYKMAKRELGYKTVLVDSLQRKCEELGNMDCITVNTTFEINNKNILSVNTTQANNISRTYATYTKNEVLAALDSLDKIK